MSPEALLEAVESKIVAEALCSRCANYQTHRLVYCNRCGNKFDVVKPTFLQTLNIGLNRPLKHFRAPLNPIHLVAGFVYRAYELNPRTENKFLDYLESLGFAQEKYLKQE